MLLTARKHGRKVRVLDSLTGEVLPTDCVNTTEGWIDLYLLRPGKTKDGGRKVMRDGKRRELAKVRLHTDFDVVTRRGRKIFQVRWPYTYMATPRPRVTKFGPLPK